MWTLDFSDGQEIRFPYPFNGRKLRPLIPRPMLSLTSDETNFCSQYHHLGLLNEQNNRDFDGSSSCSQFYNLGFLNEQSKRDHYEETPPVIVSSSRWNPTPEQLRILEELYRRGTRTPSADQIQHITKQLLRFGKIEGKNVFYWFQNHKARERQKRRRQTADLVIDESEAAREEYDVEQTKKMNWEHSKNCSITLAQECGKTQRTAKEGLDEPAAAEEQLQIKQGSDSVERNSEWYMMSQLRNPRRKTTKATMGFRSNSFAEPYREDRNSTNGVVSNEEEEGFEESQTLELFPLRSSKYNVEGRRSETKSSENSSSSFQFFEFLPLKN